jgi:hypothetical protein
VHEATDEAAVDPDQTEPRSFSSALFVKAAAPYEIAREPDRAPQLSPREPDNLLLSAIHCPAR